MANLLGGHGRTLSQQITYALPLGNEVNYFEHGLGIAKLQFNACVSLEVKNPLS